MGAISKGARGPEMAKYRELAADIANQWPGYTVRNVAVVIRTLGLVVGTRKEILTTGLWEENKVKKLVQVMQASVLNAATKIMRRQMKVNQEAEPRRTNPHSQLTSDCPSELWCFVY